MITNEQIFQGRNESVCLLKWRMDFALFCQEVLKLELKPFHKRWCQLLQYENRLAIAAPTGYGKTQIFGIAFPIWLAYFFEKSESLIVSKTVRGQSQTVLEKIKITMMDNELLKNLIPEGRDLEFSKDRMVLTTGAKIYLAPYSANVRGTHVDYIFGDEVATYPDKQDDYIIWFRDFMSRVGSKKGKVAAVSTPIEPGDLITLLLNKKGWYAEVFPVLLQEDGKASEHPYTNAIPIWPERHTFQELMAILEEQGPENFERNYQCNPRAVVAKSIFSLKDIASGYDYTRLFTHKNEGGLIIIGGDFAMSEHPNADKDAFVVVEKIIDTIIIKHIEIHHGIPVEEKLNRLMYLAQLHQPYQIICDESNVGKHIVNQLINRGWPAIPQAFGPKSRNRLLSTLKIIIGNKKLIIPYDKEDFNVIKLAEELTYQLIGFKEDKSGKSGMTTYISTAAHDDIAMALALAVAGAMEQETDVGGFASGNL